MREDMIKIPVGALSAPGQDGVDVGDLIETWAHDNHDTETMGMFAVMSQLWRLHERPTEHGFVPDKGVLPRIVCAACRENGIMIVGPRHFDSVMRQQIKLAGIKPLHMEQGFIDQWGRFYTRQEAMLVVQFNGQPFDADRNSGCGEDLYSEGLY